MPFPFRSAYPLGLPDEFTFQAIFRMTGATLNKNWNIWQMLDLNGNEQLAVNLNGEFMSLEFVYLDFGNRRHAVVFPNLQSLFNLQWHKLFLIVKRGSVTLTVDCIIVDTKNVLSRNKVNLDGFTHIGKLKDQPAIAVPVRCVKLSYSLWLHFAKFHILTRRPNNHLGLPDC